MKRILYTASTARHIRDFHLEVLSGLKAAGFDIIIACRNDGGIPLGFRTVDISFSKRFFSPMNLRAWHQLRTLLKREPVDIVSTHTALAGFVTRMALLCTRKKRPFCMHTAHGYLFGKNAALSGKLTYPFEKLCAPVTDMIMTMNSEDYGYAAKLVKKGGQVVLIRGMGVDTARFTPPMPGERERLRRELELPDGYLVFCAAEFSARKNHKELIRAMPAILRELPVYLVLAGDGALFAKIRRLAGRLGVLERVIFLGYVPDTAPYLKACDMAASASLSEGLPLAVQEAMSVGLPVMASLVKGHTDLLTDKTELLFKPCSDDISRCFAEFSRNTKEIKYSVISRDMAAAEIMRYYYGV